jgi:hypothetical protein
MNLARLAASLQLPVFPCNGKRPIVQDWGNAATNDARTIAEWFRSGSATMIGVPTGARSGLVVIDVDIKNGAQGGAWLEAHKEALPQTRTHKTQSGGLHLVFRAPDGVSIRNSASRVASGVDVRGEGGYVIWPGSPGYAVADETEPAEMPKWLIRACLPPAPDAAPRPQYQPHERYAQTALDGEIAAVIRAGEGTRNTTLHLAAVKLGSLAGAGALSRSAVEAELIRAGQMSGLDTREVMATVKSGLDYGQANPRDIPTRDTTRHTPEPPPEPEQDDPGWYESLERSLEWQQAEPDDTPPDEPQAPELDNGGILDPRDWTTPAPLREWLIPDWIPIGYATGLYGDGGLGKSLILQQLLTAASLGLPWLGMDTRAGPAFGFMCEDDPSELHRRQEAINRHYNVQPRHLELLRYTSRLGLDNILMTFDDRNRPELTPLYQELVKYLTTFRPRLVVIDTLADTFGGDEVRRAHARQYVQGVAGNIARAFACAVVVSAHPSTAGMASKSGSSGSTAWNNTFRSRLFFSQPEEEDANPDHRLLERKKSNYAQRGGQLRVQWQDGVFAPIDDAGRPDIGLTWDDIGATFDEIATRWAEGAPFSNQPASRRDGRYLPAWLCERFGLVNAAAANIVERWLVTGHLRAEKSASGLRGLRVVKDLRP